MCGTYVLPDLHRIGHLDRRLNKIYFKACKVYPGRPLFWHYYLQLSFVYSCPCLRFLLNCFVRVIKGFHQSFLQNEVDFREIQTFSQISCQKTETRFCRWKSTDNDINIFLSLENTEKKKTWKRIFTTNSELSQNRTQKQIIRFKTIINWLFNDIYTI